MLKFLIAQEHEHPCRETDTQPRVAAARQAGGPTLSVEQMSLSWAQSPPYPSALSDAILGNIGNDLEYEIDADSSSDYEHS